MRLTGIVHREGEQTHKLQTNRRSRRVHEMSGLRELLASDGGMPAGYEIVETSLVLGLLHEDSDRLWSIVVSEDGVIQMSYGPITEEPTLYDLGTITADGTLEIHEPRPA